MKHRIMRITGLSLLLLSICIQPLWGITALDLKQMIEQNTDITIVDIRSKAQYREGHIQGALNIPSSVLVMKRLPRMGETIVCGDGIRTDLTKTALNILNGKPGIQAQMLEGGYAVWESQNLPTTAAKGISKRHIHQITYLDLEQLAASDPELVLLDLRSPSESLTDLSVPFPGLSILRSKKGKISKTPLDPKHLYILIDNGTGQSEKTAAHLYASGYRRFAMLTGGELSIENKGKSGLQVKVTTGEMNKK